MSKVLKCAVLAVTHPLELRSVLNWAIWRDPTQDIKTMDESGYSRPEMRRCWEFLDMTSRSFAAVIKELEGDLCRFICLFYLVLRGLDTVEDDMSLDLERKEHLLLTFHERLSQPGWTFTESEWWASDASTGTSFLLLLHSYPLPLCSSHMLLQPCEAGSQVLPPLPYPLSPPLQRKDARLPV